MPSNLFEQIDERFRGLEQAEAPRKKEPPKPRWTEAEIARRERWIQRLRRRAMREHLAEIKRECGEVEFTEGPGRQTSLLLRLRHLDQLRVHCRRPAQVALDPLLRQKGRALLGRPPV